MMATCPSFSAAFRRNMEALGLEVPHSLFGTQQAAIGTLTMLLAPLKTLGPNATVAELIGATTGLEALAVVAGLGAAFYVGAVVGSLMVAADEAMVCTNGFQASQAAHSWALRHGFALPREVELVLLHHPEILQPSPYRRVYAERARVGAQA
ncbi:hypothetical protein AAHK20_15585 [Trinickia sp. YCB016]